jgi:hypothetical protein
MPESAAAAPFNSATALRDSNRGLLTHLSQMDEDALSASFEAEIEAFQERAKATGAILSSLEDRSEAQSIVNFWVTILYNAGATPQAVLLDPFDIDAARERAGDAPPYKGLEPFQVDDNARFFGRHEAVTAMLDRIKTSRLLAVVGLSGSGKSSAVRAGLIPRLRDGDIEGSGGWLILEPVLPGDRPLEALAQIARGADSESAALAEPADLAAALDKAGRPVLVSVDQFEELFALCASEEERRFFVDALAAAATEGEHRHIVLVTMRSEFDSHVKKYQRFAELFDAGKIQIGALSAADLRVAIEEPAAQVGVGFETGLAEELVQQVIGEPAGLPLLQFTLLELWKRRADDNQLTWEAYTALGGSPRDILANRATAVYNSFLTEDRDLSRKIFVALVQIGEGLVATSRRVVRSELGGARDNVDRVLAIWAENGLVRISPPGTIEPGSHVEVAHEALIRNWDLLRDWTDDAFASARRRRVLTELAIAWQENPSRTDLLLGEISLRDIAQFGHLDQREQDYVDASHVEVDRQERRLRFQRRIAWAGSLVGLVLFAAAVFFIFVATNKTRAAAEAGDELRIKVAELQRMQANTVRYERAALRSQRLLANAEVKRQEAGQVFNRLLAEQQYLQTELVSTRSSMAAMHGRREQLRVDTRAAETELVRVRQRASRDVALAQAEVTQLRTQAQALAAAEGVRFAAQQLRIRQASEEAAAARQSSSAIFTALGQPVILLQDGRLRNVPEGYQEFTRNEARIARAARSVGRVHRSGAVGDASRYSGAAFMVGADVAMALQYNLPSNMSTAGMTVDFRDRPDGDPRYGFSVEGIVGFIGSSVNPTTIVLLRLAPRNQAGESLPPALAIAPAVASAGPPSGSGPGGVPLHPDLPLFLIGFPTFDPRQPEVSRGILGDDLGVKRVQPGILQNFRLSVDPRLDYNSTTFAGNGGSPIFDLATGLVIGMHHSGVLRGLRMGAPFTVEMFNSLGARAAGLVAATSAAR